MTAFTFLIALNLWCPNIQPDSTFTLRVNAVNTASDEGSVRVQLFDHNRTLVQQTDASIDNREAQISFTKLSAGRYAVRLYDDENNNQKLDSNFFRIPSERYGYSNNVRGWMGEPSFERQLFRVTSDTSITIKLK